MKGAFAGPGPFLDSLRDLGRGYIYANSDVVIELELMRVRPLLHRRDLIGALVVDPGLDQVGREDVADRQEVVVGLERVEDGAERRRDLLYLGHLVRRELVDVLVDRRGRLGLVLD